jgi:hypothetical protein
VTSHPTYDDINGPDLPCAAATLPTVGDPIVFPNPWVRTSLIRGSTPPPPPLAPPPEKEDRNVDALAVGLLELAQLGRPLHTEVDLIVFRFLYTRHCLQ